MEEKHECAPLLGILGDVGQMGATIPSISTSRAFAMEALMSFALMFVIMAVATDERAKDGFAALADHWIYWIAPIAAAVIAARVYDFLRPVAPPVHRSIIGVEGSIAE